MAVAAAPTAPAAAVGVWRRLAFVLGLVLVLGKARVVGLVTFTALVGASVAADGHPTTASLLAVLAIGVLAGGGAGAINHVLDRDIDRQMARTRARPIAAGQVSGSLVAVLGTASLVLGLGLAWMAGPGAAAHTLVAAATYILIYTKLLKRHTPQGVVIGGWTGAAAVLAGWEATGQPLTLTALALSAIVFLWTPAHFWGLAIARLEDYRRAGLPVLPVVLGPTAAVWATALSGALTFAAAFVPLASGRLGWIYGAGFVLGALLWGGSIVRLLRETTGEHAWRSYKASGLFLLLLFVGALLDVLARPI